MTTVYPFDDPSRVLEICGPHHSHLMQLESRLAEHGLQRAHCQGGEVKLKGTKEGEALAFSILRSFEKRLKNGALPDDNELHDTIDSALSPTSNFGALAANLKSPVVTKSLGQTEYLGKLTDDNYGLVFGIGPAGTGKTFLAVAAGVSGLLNNRFERLIITRPAVTAGEQLGYLPGTLEEKVDPYMLPIWDALDELLDRKQIERRMERGQIEVAPIAFMRGRTLKNAFVIVDEAQNTTSMQMKMVLTRIGRRGKMIVTGDPSQVDLPKGQTSGLKDAIGRLNDVKGITTVKLTIADVMRHELVGRIIKAYEADARQS